MNVIRRAQQWIVGRRGGVVQNETDVERRELQERLIAEHREANAVAREKLKLEIPALHARNIDTMNRAMEILRG